MDKTAYIHWYKIAQTEIDDSKIIPLLTDEEIKKKMQKADFIKLVQEADEEKKRSKLDQNEPNIYLRIYSDRLELGFAYNSSSAVSKLKKILRDVPITDRQLLVEKLRKLDDGFTTVVSRKTREYFGADIQYKLIRQEKTNTLSDDQFKIIVEDCDRIREEGKEKQKQTHRKSFFEGPAVNITQISIPKDEKIFRETVKNMVEIYRACMNVKTNTEQGRRNKVIVGSKCILLKTNDEVTITEIEKGDYSYRKDNGFSSICRRSDLMLKK